MRADQLAKISKDLMLREPFYGLFLITLNKRWEKSIPTAGVALSGINYYLLLNEDFWDSLENDKQRRGLLKHELLHIGFFHLTDYEHLSDKELANIAKDIEVNQYIDEEDLPPDPCLPSSFPELNLGLKKGTNYYYEKLQQGKKNGSCPNLNALLEAMDKGQTKCQLPGGGELTVPDHSTSEVEGMSEAEKKLIKKQTEHILKEVADSVIKSRGTVPGEFAEILERINTLEEPKFDWRSYLRRFAGGSTKVYTKKTRRKYNKRYEDNPGLKIKPRRHILFAIDTSGSVSTTELKECLNELYHVQKTGSEVTVIQADSAISHIGPFNPNEDFKIHGRGGTSFDPVLEYYNENTHKYTCLIYFTDGEAPAPVPAKGKMLWVLSSQSKENKSLIGPQIVLN